MISWEYIQRNTDTDEQIALGFILMCEKGKLRISMVEPTNAS